MLEPYYDDGNGIVLYCGDCREVLAGIESASVALVLADPPYGNGAGKSGRADGSDVKGVNTGQGGAVGTWRAWAPIEGNVEAFDPSHLLRFPRLVLFGANYYADRLPPSSSWLIWDKRNGATLDDNADAELAWTNLGGVTRIYRQCWRGFTRENDAEEPKKHLHPTQKPVALMQWILEMTTKPGDLVLDPYMGSGPVPRACANLGRRCIGVEIVEKYAEIAANRLAQAVLPW